MVSWDTVAWTLAVCFLIVLMLRVVMLLSLKAWRWQRRPETLREHISPNKIEAAQRKGRYQFTEQELTEIELLRQQLAWNTEQGSRIVKNAGKGGFGSGGGGHRGKHTGTTGFTPGVSYE